MNILGINNETTTTKDSSAAPQHVYCLLPVNPPSFHTHELRDSSVEGDVVVEEGIQEERRRTSREGPLAPLFC